MMERLALLEARIRDRLNEARRRNEQLQASIGREMAQHEARSQAFATASQRLMEGFILPRMELLSGMFPQAQLTSSNELTTCQCECRFERTPEYPASTKLRIAVSPNDDVTSAIISYSLEILPIFFQFDRHDEFAVSFDLLSEDSVGAWLDAKVMQFVADYLQVPLIDQYQQDNFVIDPVCGMRINRAHAAGAVVHQEQTYFFCVDACRAKFADDPRRYCVQR